MEGPEKKSGRNLVLLGIISVAVAIMTTTVSLLIYHNSGDIYLDRSRPGFLPDEEEVADEENREESYAFEKSGLMTMEILEKYLEEFKKNLTLIDAYSAPFSQEALSNGTLGIPEE